MATFIGWVPTALGRLSFTRIGDRYEPKCSSVNTTAHTAFAALFGIQRVRANLWRFEWLTRFWGKHATTDIAFFLEPDTCALPYPRSDADTDGEHSSVVLGQTDDGCLSGEVYFLNEWSFFLGRPAFTALDLLRDATISARSATSYDAIKSLRNASRSKIRATWRWMGRQVAGRKATPRFGKAHVQLLRTGECRITVELDDMAEWQAMKAFGILPRMDERVRSSVEAVILGEAAHNVFIGLRNLAHKHYHHDPKDSISYPITRMGDDDDHNWRKRTLEGLMRMCVAQRRKETSKAYRRALGILAYADAFHRHIAGWYVSGGSVKISPNKAEYDFGALKSSIDASLKERELRDQNVRARILFSVGILITAFTILLPTYRARIEATSEGLPLTKYPTGPGADAFSDFVALVLAHPFASSIAAILIGLVIDKAVTSLSVAHPIYHWNRIIDHMTGRIVAASRRVVPGARESRYVVVITTILFSLGLAAIWYHIAQQIHLPIG